MPSESDPCGEGVGASIKPPPEDGDDDDDVDKGCAEMAVVAAALTIPGVPVVEVLPKGGKRPVENRDDVERRDAREPGRSGEARIGGRWDAVAEPEW